MSVLKSLGVDPKMYKHVKTDGKSTTLQHKHGHQLVIAHNVLSPKMQTQLKALSKVGAEDQTDVQAQEAQDEKPRKAMADGGMMPYDEVSNYAQGGPCLNPNCSSNGQSHPNCKCYGGMAEGGMAKSICSAKGKHQQDCQYYADGGSVGDKQEQNETIVHPDKGYGKIIQIMAEGGEILHKGPMTPEIQKMISNGHPGMYAEGGEAESDKVMTPMDQSKPQSPVNININSGPQPQQAPSQEPQSEMDKIRHGYQQMIQKAPASPQGEALSNPQQPQAPAPVQAPAQEQSPQQPQAQAPVPQPAPMPAAPPQPVQPPDPFTQARMASIASMNDDKSKWGQDLKDGHITPKTYESLFADKSTTGKIGTIFGMLLSGAGSGLAHQSNAMFDMMNNQIKNDLQAQEKSKDNAQNYLRLAQQHELNRSQSKQMDAETALKSKALANIYMNQSALHSLVEKANKLPVGSPEYQRAQQGLAMLSGQINNADLNLMDRAAIGQAQFNSFANPAQGGSSEEAFNQQQKQRLLMGPQGQAMAQFSAGKHLPGWQGEATRDIPEDARNKINAMTVLDDKGKDVLSYVKAHSGTWNPQTRAVAQQKIEEMKNFYNDSIKGGALTQGRLGWYDEQFAKHPTDILAQLMGSSAKLNEMVNSNSHRRDLEVKNLGLDPKKRQDSQQSQPQGQGTIERLDPKSGRIVIYDSNTKQPLRYK